MAKLDGGGDNAEGNEGKDSWGPYEVGGKGNDKDKGKEGKGSLAYDPQEELFAGVLMRDGNYCCTKAGALISSSN